MPGYPRSSQTDFELGIRQVVEIDLEEGAKYPRRSSMPVLFAYIAIFGVFLPGLFMGLGNFIICPFSIPNGWNMPGNEARGRCDQPGAKKAAIIYTCINIFYGVFIGYASKHLIHRTFSSIQEYFAKRKRIYEQGRKSEVDRITKEKVLAEKMRIQAKLEEAEQKIVEIAQQGESWGELQDAIGGYKAKSSRKGYSSKSSHRPRREINDSEDGVSHGVQTSQPIKRSAHPRAYVQEEPSLNPRVVQPTDGVRPGSTRDPHIAEQYTSQIPASTHESGTKAPGCGPTKGSSKQGHGQHRN